MARKTWPEPKIPDEVADWSLDWSDELDDGDVITASTWDVPTGITKTSESFADASTTIWLSGGTAGESYMFTNHVETQGGRHFDQEVVLRAEKDNDFASYADVDLADAYMDGAFHSDGWEDLGYDDKYKALVTATRTLDRQQWAGSKTDPLQENQWPRTGTGIDGATDAVVP